MPGLTFARRHKTRLAKRLAAKLGQRTNDQRIDTDQIQLTVGQLAFRKQSGNVGTLEYKVCTRLGQRLAHQVRHLFAQRVAMVVTKQRSTVIGPGFIARKAGY